MDFNEFEIEDAEIAKNIKYSDEIEFLVIQLNQMAHMAGRYDRGIQLKKAFHILKTLDDMKAKNK